MDSYHTEQTEFLHLNEPTVINEELHRPDRSQVHLKESSP